MYKRQPLIVTNCVILGRAEAFASRNGPVSSAADGFGMGMGFTVVLTGIGAIREILGSGTLFANAALMLGAPMGFLDTTIIPDYKGFLLIILPPGGFLVLGFALAAKRILDARASRRDMAAEPASACH